MTMGQGLHEKRSAPERRKQPSVGSRRFGYFVAAAVNVGCLWAVNQLLGWGWPAFLTDSFEDLLPWINLSLAASIVVNVAWLLRDPTWSKHVGQLVLDAISIVVVVRTWQIFPFDFAGDWSGWEPLFRIALGVGFFGVTVDMIVRVVKLAKLCVQPPSDRAAEPQAPPATQEPAAR